MEAPYYSQFVQSTFVEKNNRTIKEEYYDRISKIYNSKECNINDEKIKKEKLDKINELLDEKYYGREHDLYIKICNKYNIKPEYNEEYIPNPSYSWNKIYEAFTEVPDEIKCYECNELIKYNDIPKNEINNGYFFACAQCSPNRDSIQNVKWKKEFSSDIAEFKHQNFMVFTNQTGHKSATADGRGVNSGIHCWRWYIKDAGHWVMPGVCEPKKYNESSYIAQGVWAISTANQCYRNGVCTYDIQSNCFSDKPELYLDMLLDITKGELKWKRCDFVDEVKIANFPKDGIKFYVPHVNIYNTGTKVQLKKVSPSWYGKGENRVKFTYKN